MVFIKKYSGHVFWFVRERWGNIIIIADRRMLFGSPQDSCSEKSFGVKCCSVCNNIVVQTWSVCGAIVIAGVECCSICNNIVVQTRSAQCHRHGRSRMLFNVQQHSCSDMVGLQCHRHDRSRMLLHLQQHCCSDTVGAVPSSRPE